MNEQEIKDLLEGVAEKTRTAIDGRLGGIEKTLERQGEEMRKLGYNMGSNEKPISEIVTAEALKGLQDGSKRSIQFKIPTATVNKTQVTRASVGSSTMSQVVPGVGQLTYLGTKLRGLFRTEQVGPNSAGNLTYFDQATVSRGADMTAEASTKPESAVTWVERSVKIEKIADTIPVTREALKDVGFIQGEITRLLNVNLALREDSQLYSGDGNTPNLKGVYTSAATFNPATWDGPSIYEASFFDLIAIMATKISSGKEGKYSPNTVVMHPYDALRLRLSKDINGQYLLPSFVGADGQMVSGLRAVTSAQVTQNTCLVGDFNFGTIYDLEGVTVEMGYINDQFVKNGITVLAEKRLGLLIRTVDEDAFLKCTNIGLAINTLSYS